MRAREYCLAPANGVAMKIWQCYDNLAAQQWVYGNDNKITLEGKGSYLFFLLFVISKDVFIFSRWMLGQCLDLENGNTKSGGKVQTWQCSMGNNNQVWAR